MTLGALLRAWRLGAGLSQAEAALAAGTTQGTWSRWEKGDHQPDAESLRAIVAATKGGLSAEALVSAARPIRAAG